MSDDRDIGEGYPEEQPGDAAPGGGSSDRSGGDTGKTKDDSDSDPGTATGNPDAAG